MLVFSVQHVSIIFLFYRMEDQKKQTRLYCSGLEIVPFPAHQKCGKPKSSLCRQSKLQEWESLGTFALFDSGSVIKFDSRQVSNQKPIGEQNLMKQLVRQQQTTACSIQIFVSFLFKMIKITPEIVFFVSRFSLSF